MSGIASQPNNPDYGLGADGAGPEGYLMPSERLVRFFDDTDEVPKEIRSETFGITTRNNALTNIIGKEELTRERRNLRKTMRAFRMSPEGQYLTYGDFKQIERYVKLQLLKAINGQERKLLAPWHQSIIQERSGEEAPQGVKAAANKVLGRK